MPLTTSRMSAERCRPPGFSGGISGWISHHCSSLRSEGYGLRPMPHGLADPAGGANGRLRKHPLSTHTPAMMYDALEHPFVWARARPHGGTTRAVSSAGDCGT